MALAKIFAAAAVVVSLTGAAAAAPVGPSATGGADSLVTNVAQGCGPGWARGPYGGCRPIYGRRFYGGPRFYGPPRFYGRPHWYGRHGHHRRWHRW